MTIPYLSYFYRSFDLQFTCQNSFWRDVKQKIVFQWRYWYIQHIIQKVNALKMGKVKTVYRCEQCGTDHPKWAGQCSDCGEWNSLTEVRIEPVVSHRAKPMGGGYAGQAANVTLLNQITVSNETRLATGIGEFDRVLGGGLVTGSVVLIGGDPGIGKSTILLQTATHMAAAKNSALYVTGEESLSQVALRANRLDLATDKLQVMAETCVERICDTLAQLRPAVAILDSIQTLYTETLQSAPGGVSQIRESAALLTRFAKIVVQHYSLLVTSPKKVPWQVHVCLNTWSIASCILKGNLTPAIV